MVPEGWPMAISSVGEETRRALVLILHRSSEPYSMTVDGTFESGQLTYNRNIRTILASDGDVLINHRVTGRRTGDCAAEAPAEGNQAKAE